MSWLSDAMGRRPDWARTLLPDLINTDYSQLRPGQTGEALRSFASPGSLFNLGWHGQENPTPKQEKEQRWTIPLFRTGMSAVLGGAGSSFLPSGTAGAGGLFGGDYGIGTTGTGGATAGLNPYYAAGATGGEPAAGGGINWGQLFGQDGAGQMGIMGLMGLLNARRQKKDARAGEEDDAAAVQQGTNMLARSLSTEGNPAGSGRAQQELQNYATTALARYKAARRARESEATGNMYGAGGVSLAALLQALAQSGAFSGSSGGTA